MKQHNKKQEVDPDLVLVVVLPPTLVELLLQGALGFGQSLLVHVPHVTNALTVLEETAHLAQHAAVVNLQRFLCVQRTNDRFNCWLITSTNIKFNYDF